MIYFIIVGIFIIIGIVAFIVVEEDKSFQTLSIITFGAICLGVFVAYLTYSIVYFDVHNKPKYQTYRISTVQLHKIDNDWYKYREKSLDNKTIVVNLYDKNTDINTEVEFETKDITFIDTEKKNGYVEVEEKKFNSSNWLKKWLLIFPNDQSDLEPNKKILYVPKK